MKFTPRQLSSTPFVPPKAMTTTRFLRLQPAADVPVVTPKTEEPATPGKPAPAPITLPPGATGSQRLRLRPAPDVAPALSSASAPVVESPSPSPEPAPEMEELFLAPEPPAVEESLEVSPPAPAPELPAMAESLSASPPAPMPPKSSPSTAPSSSQPPGDDRPMRITTKRLPNVYASAPSARWTSSGTGPGTAKLRLIPPTALAAPTASAETSAASHQPSLPALSEEAKSPETSETEPEEITSSSPSILRPKKTSLLPVAPKPEEPDAPASSRRLAHPVPLSRLKGGESHTLDSGFWILFVFLAIFLIGALSFFGITPRIVFDRVLDLVQKSGAQPVVTYGVARLTTPQVELPLPGTIEAFQEASIQSRTSGYIKKWDADIGDQVKEGQVLVELDAPELDQELTKARVAEEKAKATLATVQNTNPSGNDTAHPASQQDLDEKNIAISGAQADLSAAQANIQGLTDLEKAKEIRAPFSGKITYRHPDVGGLVSAGPAAAHEELFRISQTDPIHIFIDVPAASAPSIKPGVPATVQVTSYPDRVFHGEVMHDAGALDESSHTLRTEIRVPNPDGALLPGALAEVHLQLVDNTPTLLIPATALIVNATTGTSVAILQSKDGHDVVHYAAVRVGREFGPEVEIFGKVKEGDRLITNSPPDLNEGTVVTAQRVSQAAAH